MRKALTWVVAAGVTGLPFLVPGIANAAVTHSSSQSNRTVYVSPDGKMGAADRSCGSAAFSSVQAAVNGVAARGTVVVCAGTYDESVTVTKALTLSGRPGAVINAKGDSYGVGVAASYTTVTGLTVENASVGATLADGIVTAGLVNGTMTPANHVTIIRDVTKNNVGSGIDLNSTTGSTAIDDKSEGNAVGINVSDDFNKTATDNTIMNNVADNNPGGCGIALADHTGKGISHNRVINNVSDDNGLGTAAGTAASAGSGVILAGATGGVFDNTISGNTFNGNGHAGFDVHAHVAGMNLTGNVVTGNRIGTNNLRGSENDNDTTGVYLGDASPLDITVKNNVISGDHFGVFASGPKVTINGIHQNVFRNVTTLLGTAPTFD
jgi:Periplasmic copper-binding protein (NosD)